MPDRFRGHHIPGVFYAYPGESMTALGMVGASLILMLPPYPLDGRAMFGVDGMWLMMGLGFYSMVAGIITFIGLWNWRKTWQSGVEQLGLWLIAGACATYIYILFLIASPNTATLPTVVLGCVGLSCVLRARAIRILQAEKLEELIVANQLREETAKHGTVDNRPAENPRPGDTRG